MCTLQSGNATQDHGEDKEVIPLLKRTLQIFDTEFGPHYPSTETVLKKITFVLKIGAEDSERADLAAHR